MQNIPKHAMPGFISLQTSRSSYARLTRGEAVTCRCFVDMLCTLVNPHSTDTYSRSIRSSCHADTALHMY
jgi:hypothetical protein